MNKFKPIGKFEKVTLTNKNHNKSYHNDLKNTWLLYITAGMAVLVIVIWVTAIL